MINKNSNEVLKEIILKIPNVESGSHINNLNFLIEKKVFAFTKNNQLILKLPEEKIKELVKKNKAKNLIMGKKVMREWAVIEHKNPENYKNDKDLIRESVNFVSAMQKIRKKSQ